MDSAGAYGAGRAGAPFNPIVYIKKPEVITRLFALLFAIIVFGCLASRGYNEAEPKLCFINGDPNACGYGIGIGVLAFLICIGFLVLDALFEQLSSVQQRRYAVLADIAVSGLWCFLWFVGFCYMTTQWSHTAKTSIAINFAVNDIQAALAFSFFSFLAWAALVVLAVVRYRKGVSENFNGGEDVSGRPDIAQSSNPYASFGGEVGQSTYQQPPFTGNPDAPAAQTAGKTDYPAY